MNNLEGKQKESAANKDFKLRFMHPKSGECQFGIKPVHQFVELVTTEELQVLKANPPICSSCDVEYDCISVVVLKLL